MKITFESSANLNPSISQHYLPLYAGRVSCGLFGIADDFVDEYLSLDERFIKNKEATFFVKAQGDSMAPNIVTGDILIVDRSIKVFSGAVVAIFYNDNAICKQYLKKEGQTLLSSFSSEVKDITVSDDDRLELFGVVVGLARNFY
jgi:DNA polymerase V